MASGLLLAGCHGTAGVVQGRQNDFFEPMTAIAAPPKPADNLPCQRNLVAKLPNHAQRSHLLVDVAVNKMPARLMFDSGSLQTVLSPDSAARLQLSRTASKAG